MQRLTSVFVGVLVASALVFVMAWRGHPRSHAPHTPPGASGSAKAAAVVLPEPAPTASLELPQPEDPLALPEGDEWPSDAGKLPADAPSTVGFGVILFTYKGAQGAPANARPKEEARALAKGIVEAAQKDFAEAVKKGDHGSTADAGHIPRGVLEPDVETALFKLEKGAVNPEPLDTPRGFWVVRRTD
jgi:hypothetical protein